MRKSTRCTIGIIMTFLFLFAVFAPLAHAADVIAQPGDNNATVGEINTMLKALGYYYGTVNNTYGTATKAAVNLYQRAKGLTATGIVDEQTYTAMKADYQAKGGKSTPTPTTAPDKNTNTNTNSNTNTNTNTNTGTTATGLTAAEQQMINMVNQERAKAGVAPLQVDMRLVTSARVKSQDMITNNYFSHTSPVLGSFIALIRKYAPDYKAVGENLAGNKEVTAAMTAFMNSSGHRANILNPSYTHIGVGIVTGGPYGAMFTQHFGG